MKFEIDRVRSNVRRADTEDLLDRITVYRLALEPEAIDVIMAELKHRGLAESDIRRHESARSDVVVDKFGIPRPCTVCRRPASAAEWGWHRLFNLIPLFPRRLYRCEHHRRMR